MQSKLEDHYAAISDFTKAIKIDQDDDLLYAARGYSKGKIKDFEGAISDYSKAIFINPDLDFAHYNRGLMNYNSDKFKEACADWIKASELGYEYAFKEADNCKNSDNFKASIKNLLGNK